MNQALHLPVSARHRLVIVVALVTTAALLAPAIISADSWPGPRPQVFASARGAYTFRTRPPQLNTWSGKSHGTVFARAADGTEAPLWTRELINIPVTAFVADDGKHVVTFDTWARLGYEHALVIYGDHGEVVVDYDLETLLPADDINTSVVHTVSARRWLQGATIAFDTGGKDIVIKLSWGKTIRVALATGAIETGQ